MAVRLPKVTWVMNPGENAGRDGDKGHPWKTQWLSFRCLLLMPGLKNVMLGDDTKTHLTLLPTSCVVHVHALKFSP